MADTKTYKKPGGRMYDVKSAIAKNIFNPMVSLSNGDNFLYAQCLTLEKEKLQIAHPMAGTDVLFYVRICGMDVFPSSATLKTLDSAGDIVALTDCVDGIYPLYWENISQNLNNGLTQGLWLSLPEKEWEEWPDEFTIFAD